MTSGTDEVKCGKCIQCCQWGWEGQLRPVLQPNELHLFDHDIVRGLPRLAISAVGECVYLSHDGCKIHDKRPQVCRDFDCRALYTDTMKKRGVLMIKILLQGAMRVEGKK